MSPTGMQPKKQAEPQRSPEEVKFLEAIEKWKGRPLTDQEANLSIEQAKALGEL